METQMYYLAVLGHIDRRLDDLNEEFGDLPEIVRQRELKVKTAQEIVDETNKILADIKQFCSTSKVTLQELKTKEEKLAKQQFNVRNNKEFDAITKEIAFIREEHVRLTDLLRSEGIKEENLMGILEFQVEDLKFCEQELKDKKDELDFLSNDQNEEVSMLTKKRKAILKKINKAAIIEYERIRVFHKDSSVRIRRNSCSGCFSQIPPQKIVEIRSDIKDNLFFCENCGRILYNEEIIITDALLTSIK
jgi:uncharacterized protein